MAAVSPPSSSANAGAARIANAKKTIFEMSIKVTFGHSGYVILFKSFSKVLDIFI
jgi:hypothetical protein